LIFDWLKKEALVTVSWRYLPLEWGNPTQRREGARAGKAQAKDGGKK
jgi:hypothetical protein